MVLRSFAPAIEVIAEKWRSEPETSEAWQAHPARGSFTSAEKPFWVTNGELMGVAKPGQITARTNRIPVAAQEKIASDLAFDLDLPIPPVILWNRRGVKDKESQLVAISAVPFAQPRTWGELRNEARILEMLRPALTKVASYMCAFDMWLQNVDHQNHDGNLLLGMQSGAANIAYIDYGHSMAHTWKSDGPENQFCAPVYVPGLEVDAESLREAIEGIESLPQDRICNVVSRIPLHYISADDKKLIIDGLLKRQKNLRNIVKRTYVGV